MKQSFEGSSLHSITLPTTGNVPNFVFVGGKGGVGKTSCSSAIAINLSDQGFRTLIVSTDPAHSLGDAFDFDFSSGQITPIVTEQNLWALEIDVEATLEEFKQKASNLDPNYIAESTGIPREILDTIGLDEIANIFRNPPPGVDEIVALLKIFKYADEKLPNGKPKYDRIVIDTAPTGHTVRLLQLPQFITTVTTNLIKLKSTVTGALDKVKNLFGGGGSMDKSEKALNDVMNSIEEFRNNLDRMRKLLKDHKQTQFVIVTIPTTLAVTESKRLVSELKSEDVKVSTIICNQVLNEELAPSYLQTRRNGQEKCIKDINAASSIASKLAGTNPIEITEVPQVDTEVTGIYGLRFFSSLAHAPKKGSATNPIDSRKLTIFGGKGGVGKTTSAASWAIQLADFGMRTLVVSTDPAHSLGDALMEKLNGKPRLIDKTAEGGELWAMEVDPEEALVNFRKAIGQKKEGVLSSNDNTGLLGGLKNELSNLMSQIYDPPPGTDEIVAMTEIIDYLEKGYTLPNGKTMKFDRIVLDTAPTGHTLRMLKLPIFLRDSVQKIKSLQLKMKSMSGLAGMLGGAMGNAFDSNPSSDSNDGENNELANLESNMEKLDQILHESKEAEFTVVTIATELAAAETKRLLMSLQDDNIAVRRVIINQVIQQQTLENPNDYLTKIRQGQKSSINELENIANTNEVPLVLVPYLDTEVRTVYGLRVIGNTIFSKK